MIAGYKKKIDFGYLLLKISPIAHASYIQHAFLPLIRDET
jgi:hypothetical protein